MSLPSVQDIASFTAAFARKNGSRASRDSRSPEMVSSGCWGDSLNSEALHMVEGKGGGSLQRHCPHCSRGPLGHWCPGAHMGGLEGRRGN